MKCLILLNARKRVKIQSSKAKATDQHNAKSKDDATENYYQY